MRHRHGLRKLNRTSSHRLAMLRNMTNSLFTHEAIKTTLPKAKELRRVAEPLITLGKNPTLANRRLAFDRLRDRDVVTKLFNELGPRFKARPGRLPADPEVRLPPGRRCADGADRDWSTVPMPPTWAPRRPRSAANHRMIRPGALPGLFFVRALAAGGPSMADRDPFSKTCSIRSHARDSSGHRRRRFRRFPRRRRAGACRITRPSSSTISATARRRSARVSRRLAGRPVPCVDGRCPRRRRRCAPRSTIIRLPRSSIARVSRTSPSRKRGRWRTTTSTSAARCR